MKNLPLLILGAGAALFFSRATKPLIIKTPKEIVYDDQIGSKEVGYKIVDCSLTIYDKQKAYNHAFKLGADNALGIKLDGVKPLKETLFGGCLEKELTVKALMTTKEKALFIFDLMRFLYSGIVSKSIEFEEDYDNGFPTLQGFKNNIAKITGFDVSDFKVEVIKK